MSVLARSSVGTELVGRLAVRGKAAAAVGRELDSLRALGPRLYRSQARDPIAHQLATSGRKSVYRSIWEDAVRAVGGEVREFPPGYLLVQRGDRSLRLWGHFVPVDDPVTLRLAGDKPAAHALLAEAGLPVPRHRTVRVPDLDEALDFLHQTERIVVKPASSTGAGSGVTGGVRTRADFLSARLAAARHDADRLLLEEHADGDEYRVLVLDGDPIGVVRRLPPRVVGDGVSTVKALVHAENLRRQAADGWAGLWPIRLDLDARIALRHQDLGLGSVPAAAHVISVKHSTSEGSEKDATVVEVGDPAVAGVVGDAARAARAIGVRLASVEMVTLDARVPIRDAGGVVIEVNTTPGLAQHYIVSNVDHAVPVAATVIDRLLTAQPPD